MEKPPITKFYVTTERPIRHLFAAILFMCRPLRQWWARFWYYLLVRVNRLPLYHQSIPERVGQQLAFVNLYQQQREVYPWIPKLQYLIGGSADPAFMSILIRALTENKFRSVLEFGAGQTTRLLSAWSVETGGTVFTVDHDLEWVAQSRRLTTSATHHVIHAPLRTGPQGDWYDLAAFKMQFPDAKADLIIVDGPVGTRRMSRAGFIEEFPNVSGSQYVILWDDLNRFGDFESFAAFVDGLQKKGGECEVKFCQAFRTLGMVFTPSYSSLRYYC